MVFLMKLLLVVLILTSSSQTGSWSEASAAGNNPENPTPNLTAQSLVSLLNTLLCDNLFIFWSAPFGYSFSFQCKSNSQHQLDPSSAGVGNLRPAGRIRPAEHFDQAHLLQSLSMFVKIEDVKHPPQKNLKMTVQLWSRGSSYCNIYLQ